MSIPHNFVNVSNLYLRLTFWAPSVLTWMKLNMKSDTWLMKIVLQLEYSFRSTCPLLLQIMPGSLDWYWSHNILLLGLRSLDLINLPAVLADMDVLHCFACMQKGYNGVRAFAISFHKYPTCAKSLIFSISICTRYLCQYKRDRWIAARLSFLSPSLIRLQVLLMPDLV